MPIRKRGDSWQVDVRIHGKRIRETFRTKKEAIVRERELITQEVTGTYQARRIEPITFQQFVPQYLEYARANKAEQTVYNETWMLNRNMTPFFGNMPLAGIQPLHIERYKARRLSDGLQNRTVNIELQLLSVLFKLAVKWNYARDNPVAKVDRLKEPDKPRRFLSEEEVRRLLTAAKRSYLYPLVVCALHTGMRPKELYDLKWQDIDFERGTILVRSSKTNTYRAIEMTPMLRVTLSRHAEYRESDYVFAYRGKPIRSAKKAFKQICQRAGIQDCTLYTLRHTFASHLAMQGVPLLYIQRLMGHERSSTTEIYAHLSSESQRGHVQRLPFADVVEEDE